MDCTRILDGLQGDGTVDSRYIVELCHVMTNPLANCSDGIVGLHKDCGIGHYWMWAGCPFSFLFLVPYILPLNLLPGLQRIVEGFKIVLGL